MKRQTGRIFPVLCALFVLWGGITGSAESAGEAFTPAPEEQKGYSELSGLLEKSELGAEGEGMTLEEITDAFTNGAMKEYVNEESGLSVQFPATFEFQEETGDFAVSENGLARLEITSIQKGKESLLKSIMEMTKEGVRDAACDYQPEMGTLIMKRTDPENSTVYADLYLETDSWLHHAALTYPESEAGKYDPFLSYMLHSMTSSESEQG